MIMKALPRYFVFLFFSIIIFASSKVYSDNAPITTIANATICPGLTFTTQVTVTGFSNIGSITLRIEYDSTVMSFNPPPATFFNPALASASISSTPVSGTTKKIMIAWASTTPLSLSDGSMLVTLSFNFINWSTALSFNNDSNGGGDCEYANGSGIPLNDVPTSTYYINGQVNSAGAPWPSPITGPIGPCQGSGAAYSVIPVAGVTYTWSLPAGWTLNSGQGTSTILTTVGNTSGSIVVVPSNNNCGNGPSRNLAVSPLLLPANPGAISGPSTPCQRSAGNVYSVNPVSNATGYLWTVPDTSWIITSGQNTHSVIITAGTSNGNITVTASNFCGNSNTSVFPVTPLPTPIANAGPDQVLGYGSSATLNGSATGGSGNYSWHWEPANLLINPNIQNPVTVNLTSSVQFTLTVTDNTSSCTASDKVLITITGGPLSLLVLANPDPVCYGSSTQLLALPSGGTGNYTFAWTSDPPGFSSPMQNPVVIPAATITYIVTVNDGFAMLTDSVLVTVLPLPGIPAQPSGPDTIDLEYVITSTYSVPAVPSVNSYTWDLLPIDAGSISGTGQSANVTWSQAFIGTAHIKVKTTNSCGESDWSAEKITLVERTSAVADHSGTVYMSVFPNPSHGVFYLRLESESREPFELTILDIMGKTLLTIQDIRISGSLEKEINFTPGSKGIYLLVLKNRENFTLRRILIY